MKNTKWVKYVGNTTTNLIKGKFYSVTAIDFHSDAFTLEGIEGKFSRNMFQEVEETEVLQKQSYIAFAKRIPEIGKELFLVRIENGNIQPVNITEIIDVSFLEGDIYRIETENSVYMTEIKA